MVTFGRSSRRVTWLVDGQVRSDKKRRMATRRREEDNSASEAKTSGRNEGRMEVGVAKGACDLDNLYDGNSGRRAAAE